MRYIKQSEVGREKNQRLEADDKLKKSAESMMRNIGQCCEDFDYNLQGSLQLRVVATNLFVKGDESDMVDDRQIEYNTGLRHKYKHQVHRLEAESDSSQHSS